MGLFHRRKSILESGLLKGAVDNHSHILYGLDDGVKTQEDALSILRFLEEEGVSEVWFTPHVMEDVPNTTEGIRARFEELKALYRGGLRFHLAAEYMIDTLFEERLAAKDLLQHGEGLVLVETSSVAPPINLWEVLDAMLKAGYRPLIAHPERYRYMEKEDYRRLHDMGCLMQMNLPSIVGFYGESARERALDLLDKGWYSMVGSDCHRFRAIQAQYAARELKKDTLRKLVPLMGGLRDEI
ncbi:MAG: capsular biosynthesis protein [Bacteroidales bacterium]|nr:capsular biosynthesis protein [Bacteroidales bacterium]